MPKATVSRDTIHRDLRSCPGGWVELRTLSYYEMMQRRDLMARLFTEVSPGSGSGRNPKAEDIRQVMESMQVVVMEYEFKNCISDHNLEDGNGLKLDFNSPLALKMLDPKIGAEIGRYIDELNQEDEEDLSDSASAAISLLQDGMRKPEPTTLDPSTSTVTDGSQLEQSVED